MTRRRWTVLVSGLMLTLMLGCSGNPLRQFRLLDFRATPTELPPEGGRVQVEVEATRGDGAEVKVIRKLDEQVFVLFTVRLSEVSALDLEKKRWKGTVDLPPNNDPEDKRYALIISVWDDDDRDERLVEVIVKGRPLAGNP
ncbi:MAG: hypothetical protein BDTLLHRC_001495 [Candidatus Fervidibacter sp.]